MTKKKRYKRYSPEFKREALKRASDEGVTDVIVCEELGISARQLRRWRDECRGFDADDTTTMTLVRFPVGDVICQAKGREKNKYKNCT
jgi:transposase